MSARTWVEFIMDAWRIDMYDVRDMQGVRVISCVAQNIADNCEAKTISRYIESRNIPF